MVWDGRSVTVPKERLLYLPVSDRLHEALFELVQNHGTALVVVTHNPSLARMTDRILDLRGGVLRPVDRAILSDRRQDSMP